MHPMCLHITISSGVCLREFSEIKNRSKYHDTLTPALLYPFALKLPPTANYGNPTTLDSWDGPRHDFSCLWIVVTYSLVTSLATQKPGHSILLIPKSLTKRLPALISCGINIRSMVMTQCYCGWNQHNILKLMNHLDDSQSMESFVLWMFYAHLYCIDAQHPAQLYRWCLYQRFEIWRQCIYLQTRVHSLASAALGNEAQLGSQPVASPEHRENAHGHLQLLHNKANKFPKRNLLARIEIRFKTSRGVSGRFCLNGATATWEPVCDTVFGETNLNHFGTLRTTYESWNKGFVSCEVYQ